jgi:hypothetical protein
MLGLITGITYYYAVKTYQAMMVPRVIAIEIASADTGEYTEESTPDTATPPIAVSVDTDIAKIADTIWLRESTRGINNYSKCEAQGLTNGIGYGIPGNGTYQCFQNHEEEMERLERWILNKRAKGLSDIELMCLYSGSNYAECK